MNETVIIIPSRLDAERLPNKPLELINNKEMILHVYEAAKKTNSEVYVATPYQKIIDIVHRSKGKAVFTSIEHQTGTDRVYEVFKDHLKSEPNLIINLQGDMPNIEPKAISDLIDYMKEGNCDIGTLASSFSSDIELAIDRYFSNNCRPLVSGTRQHLFIWNNDGFTMNYDPYNRPRRQEWEGTFIENGAIYIFKVQDFKIYGTRCNLPCTLFEMSQPNAIELDNDYDWIALENIIDTKDK